MACSQRVRKQPLPPPRGCSRAAFSLQRRTIRGLRRPPGTAALVPSVSVQLHLSVLPCAVLRCVWIGLIA